MVSKNSDIFIYVDTGKHNASIFLSITGYLDSVSVEALELKVPGFLFCITNAPNLWFDASTNISMHILQ